jgi:hypothetical protein
MVETQIQEFGMEQEQLWKKLISAVSKSEYLQSDKESLMMQMNEKETKAVKQQEDAIHQQKELKTQLAARVLLKGP